VDILEALACVSDSLHEAIHKHPQWETDPRIAVSILTEELGELATAANDFVDGDGNVYQMKAEATHVAAVAIRFLLNLETFSNRGV